MTREIREFYRLYYYLICLRAYPREMRIRLNLAYEQRVARSFFIRTDFVIPVELCRPCDL